MSFMTMGRRPSIGCVRREVCNYFVVLVVGTFPSSSRSILVVPASSYEVEGTFSSSSSGSILVVVERLSVISSVKLA